MWRRFDFSSSKDLTYWPEGLQSSILGNLRMTNSETLTIDHIDIL
jgi:hypothetical protein